MIKNIDKRRHLKLVLPACALFLASNLFAETQEVKEVSVQAVPVVKQTDVAKTEKAPVKKLVSQEAPVKATDPAKLKEIEMVLKTVTGEAGAKNSRGMSLVYKRDTKEKSEMELWLPFSEKMELTGYKTMKDVSLGDLVKVTFEESKEGGFDRKIKRLELRKKVVEEPKAQNDEPSASAVQRA